MSEDPRTPAPDPAEAASQRLVADLVEQRLSDFAEVAARAILDTIPAYASADAGLRQDVAAHCRDAYAAVVVTLRRGGEPRIADFVSTADRASRRVAQGISLSDFLRAFRITQASLWDSVREVGRDDPDVAAAAPDVVAALMQTFEVGSVGAAQAYLEAQQYALADRDRLRRDLVEDLMAGRVPRTSGRVGMLEAVGLREHAPFACLVGRLTGVGRDTETESRLRRASTVLREHLGRHGAGLVSLRHDELVALLPLSRSRTLDDLVAELAGAHRVMLASGVPMRLGLSTRCDDLSAVATAHQEATTALRATNGPGVQRLDALAPGDYLTLLQDPIVLKLVPDAVRTFVHDDLADGGTLIDTLVQYAANDLNARAVAERMHLHVNSVYYRLDRATERSGLDTRTFQGISEMLTAIRLLTGGSRTAASPTGQ